MGDIILSYRRHRYRHQLLLSLPWWSQFWFGGIIFIIECIKKKMILMREKNTSESLSCSRYFRIGIASRVQWCSSATACYLCNFYLATTSWIHRLAIRINSISYAHSALGSSLQWFVWISYQIHQYLLHKPSRNGCSVILYYKRGRPYHLLMIRGPIHWLRFY